MINLRKQKGIFISVEGPEFSGKTMLIKNLQVSGLPFDIKTTREPGGTERGQILRGWVTNPIGAFANNQNLRAMGFAMDRAMHIHDLILPNLQEGKVVITDRYIDSSFVLQGLIQGLPIEEIKYTNCYANSITDISYILPEKTIFVDITEEEAIVRSKSRAEGNLMDEEFMPRFKEIRNAYLELARKDPKRYIILNGVGSFEEVQERFNSVILEIIQEHRPELIER